MNTSITTIKLQAIACALGLVLAAWPGSGSAGIMGTGIEDDSMDSASAEEETTTCFFEVFGFTCTDTEADDGESDDGGETSTQGIMGTG